MNSNFMGLVSRMLYVLHCLRTLALVLSGFLLTGAISTSTVRAAVIYSGEQNLSLNSQIGGNILSLKIFGGSDDDFEFLYVKDAPPPFPGPPGQLGQLFLKGKNGGQTAYDSNNAVAFVTNAPINNSFSYDASFYKNIATYDASTGDFAYGASGRVFLGVRKQSGSDFNYGWIRIDVPTDTTNALKVIDWAYESTANTPILAGDMGPPPSAVPEPTSMAIFGLGALGLAYHNRRKLKA